MGDVAQLVHNNWPTKTCGCRRSAVRSPPTNVRIASEELGKGLSPGGMQLPIHTRGGVTEFENRARSALVQQLPVSQRALERRDAGADDVSGPFGSLTAREGHITKNHRSFRPIR